MGVKTALMKLGMAEGDFDTHESDLYVKKTPISEKYLETYDYKDNVKEFKNEREPNVGETWYDFPFANDEWWNSKKKTNASIETISYELLKSGKNMEEVEKILAEDNKVDYTKEVKANVMYRKENGEKVRVRTTRDGRFQVYDRHDNYWYSADEDDFTEFPDDKEDNEIKSAKEKKIPKLIVEQKKIDNKHKDSFWYDGSIATMGDYELVATGEIRVQFKEDEEEFAGNSAYQEAMDRGYTDKDIRKWDFNNNNWFEVIKKDEGSWGDPDASDYDEAIELLKYYAIGEGEVEAARKVKADEDEKESMFPWGDYGDDEKFEEYWSEKHRGEVSDDFVEYFYAGDYKKAYDDLVRQMSDAEFKEAMEFIIRMNS